MDVDVEKVVQLVREVAAEELMPRFRALREHEVRSKATPEDPSDVVTHADLEAERHLTRVLRSLLPGSVVVGEEAVAENPGLLDALGRPEPAWLVDPLDGTKNFVEHRETFGTIVGLCVGGATVLGVIHLPARDVTLVAEAGSGAREISSDGDSTPVRSRRPSGTLLRGSIYTRFVSPELRAQIEANAPERALLVSGTGNASSEYAFLAHGEKDFVLYGRLLPWDHAAGALILTEAGGAVRLLDGRPYGPLVLERGAIGVREASLWEAARRTVLG
jgi:fructose-1,6-bisphosphatase/inositol monophosphatase family enzyme